jgi:hypothetical protein
MQAATRKLVFFMNLNEHYTPIPLLNIFYEVTTQKAGSKQTNAR